MSEINICVHSITDFLDCFEDNFGFNLRLSDWCLNNLRMSGRVRFLLLYDGRRVLYLLQQLLLGHSEINGLLTLVINGELLV